MSALAPSLGISLVSETRPLPQPCDPFDLLGGAEFVWLRDQAGMVAAGVAARIPVPVGPGRLRAAAARVAALLRSIGVDDTVRLPGTGPVAVGALPFSDDVEAELVVPATVVGRSPDGRCWITRTRRADEPPQPLPPATSPATVRPPRLTVPADGARTGWTQSVEQALEAIGAGVLSKVVLARQLEVHADRPFDAAEVVARLRRDQPSCFTYALGGFVGCSPELLVRRQGDRVVSRPMAGTVGRGATPADDRRLVAGLTSSEKDLSEHRLVVEAVRHALAPVCTDLVPAAAPEVVRLATVAHLATRVTGRLRPPAPSALALAALLHPTPAVGGAPRDEALAAIDRLEPFERGLYAGPVGWVDARGDGEWAVAIRCAQLEGRRARLVAGNGIVAGSDPDVEWAETEAKLEPMLRALGTREAVAEGR